MLSIQIPNILSFPCGLSINACVIFLVDPSIIFSFNNLFQTSFSTDGATSPVCLRLFIVYFIFLSSLSLCNNTYFISYAVVPNDLLYLSAAPRFRPSQVIIIYFPKLLTFNTKEIYVVNVAHYCFLLNIYTHFSSQNVFSFWMLLWTWQFLT